MKVMKEKYVVIGFQGGEDVIHLEVADCERALALASMLQKISTPEVGFSNIQVFPFKNYQIHEKK